MQEEIFPGAYIKQQTSFTNFSRFKRNIFGTFPQRSIPRKRESETFKRSIFFTLRWLEQLITSCITEFI